MKLPLETALSRRDFLRLSAGAVGAASLWTPSLLAPPAAGAFPRDELFAGVARMVFHENPWGPHPAAVEAIREVLAKGMAGGGVNRFDDFLQIGLKEAILRYNGLEGKLTHENVILGVGSTEALFMAADAYLSPETPFLTEWPTYYVILNRAAQNRAQIVKVPLLDDWTADLDTMHREARAAQERGRPFGIVHFNVINNPMGTFLDRDRFDAFARRIYADAPGSVLLCDDSDREFMEPRLQPSMFWAADHVVEGRSMLHIQTFSHTFGLTGMRVGYGIAPKEIIERMESRRSCSGVHVLGRAAAAASLEHAEEQIRRVNPLCSASREMLYRELTALGIAHVPSQGHYVMMDLVDVSGTLAVLQMYLSAHKVFVRWGRDWDMENWIRVNPGTEYENERFVTALRWLLDRSRALRGVSARECLAGTEGRRLIRAALRNGFPPRMMARMLDGLGTQTDQT